MCQVKKTNKDGNLGLVQAFALEVHAKCTSSANA